jgi:hypothetical protein
MFNVAENFNEKKNFKLTSLAIGIENDLLSKKFNKTSTKKMHKEISAFFHTYLIYFHVSLKYFIYLYVL